MSNDNKKKLNLMKALMFPGFVAGAGYDYMGEIEKDEVDNDATQDATERAVGDETHTTDCS